MNETVAKAVGESLNTFAGGQAVITTEMLAKRGACSSNVERFRELFGPNVEVTEAVALKAIENEMDIGWAAEMLLPPYHTTYRDTGDSWEYIWRRRYQGDCQEELDAVQKLRDERSAALDGAVGVEYDKLYMSFDERIDAARETKEKKLRERKAVWFARLYRESCGITTDEWQQKEKEDASKAAGIADGNADSTAETASVPSEAGGLVGEAGSADSIGSGSGDAGSSDAADPTSDSGDAEAPTSGASL